MSQQGVEIGRLENHVNQATIVFSVCDISLTRLLPGSTFIHLHRSLESMCGELACVGECLRGHISIKPHRHAEGFPAWKSDTRFGPYSNVERQYAMQKAYGQDEKSICQCKIICQWRDLGFWQSTSVETWVSLGSCKRLWSRLSCNISLTRVFLCLPKAHATHVGEGPKNNWRQVDKYEGPDSCCVSRSSNTQVHEYCMLNIQKRRGKRR